MNEKFQQTIDERQQKEKELLLKSLSEMPIVEIATKKAGVSRASYYRWLKEDLEFLKQSDKAIQEGREFINDMSEAQIVQMIKKEKMPAIALWLKNNNPRYGSKVAQKRPDRTIPELTSEEEKIFKKALAMSSSVMTVTIKKDNGKKN